MIKLNELLSGEHKMLKAFPDQKLSNAIGVPRRSIIKYIKYRINAGIPTSRKRNVNYQKGLSIPYEIEY